jgi:KDO2-lipid IV(A) lauroyltransferase
MIKKGLSRLVIFFLYLLSLLPFWMLYLLSDGLFFIIFYIVGYRRKVVQENLRNSFPEKTENEINATERKFYRFFADMVVETVKLITISPEELSRHAKVTNPEILDQYFEQGRSIIGAVGHYTNWEMGSLSFSLVTSYRRMVVFKPLSNKNADGFYEKVRSRFGATLVPMKKTLRAISEYRNEPTFTALVSDQTPVMHEAHYFTTFLNQPTAVFLGVEKIAKLTDSVVVFCDQRCVKRGYYELTLVPLVTEPKQTAENEITEAHVQYLERMINEQPEYWLWSHRRWKFKPEDVQK